MRSTIQRKQASFCAAEKHGLTQRVCCRAPSSPNLRKNVYWAIPVDSAMSRIVCRLHGEIAGILSLTNTAGTFALPQLSLRWRWESMPPDREMPSRNSFASRNTVRREIFNRRARFSISPFGTRFLPLRSLSTSAPTNSLNGVRSSFLLEESAALKVAILGGSFLGSRGETLKIGVNLSPSRYHSKRCHVGITTLFGLKF